MAPKKQPVLGPLQPIFDAWTPHEQFIDGMPNLYFRNVICIQFNEIDDHEAAGHPVEKTRNEIIDIMSICMNWLRSTGLDEGGVAEAMGNRVPRYEDTGAIIKKYNDLYGM